VRADSAEEVAEIARARRGLGLEGATLVCVPVPEEAEIPAESLNEILDEALEEAARGNIAGRELTPFLLSRMGQMSGGATLRANVALLEQNARVGAAVALALTRDC
jgi:pseudouridine-5'-phosphate glycosidase